MSTFKEANLTKAGLQSLRSLSKITNIESESDLSNVSGLG